MDMSIQRLPWDTQKKIDKDLLLCYNGHMKKIIVYFHGYGSSVNSDKVTRLKQEPGFEVYAYPANIDPVIAVKEVSDNIDLMLITDPEVSCELIFVGTSLGAWLASKMAKMYQCKAVIINPSIDPTTSLEKYGVPLKIREKYSVLAPYKGHKYFFARHDEVIDNREFRNNLTDAGFDVTIVDGADHRFAGPAFEEVIKYLNA